MQPMNIFLLQTWMAAAHSTQYLKTSTHAALKLLHVHSLHMYTACALSLKSVDAAQLQLYEHAGWSMQPIEPG
jgi:hypothetical protein